MRRLCVSTVSMRARAYSSGRSKTYSVNGQSLTLERLGIIKARDGRKKMCKRQAVLPNVMEVSIRMKVIITLNVDTHPDVANGSHGTVADVILHADELQQGSKSGPVTHLVHVPL